MIDLLKVKWVGYERLCHKTMNIEHLAMSILSQRNLNISRDRIDPKGQLSCRASVHVVQSANFTLVADFIQTFISANRFPYRCFFLSHFVYLFVCLLMKRSSFVLFILYLYFFAQKLMG